MISESKTLRELQRNLLSGLAKAIPLGPNAISLLAFLCALIPFFFSEKDWLWFGLAFLLDALDGVVAREKGMESKLGAFLDGNLDRIIEFLVSVYILTHYIIIEKDVIAILTALFFGGCMTSFAKAYSKAKGMEISFQTFFGRGERAVFWILFLIFKDITFIYLLSVFSVLTYILLLLQVFLRGPTSS